MQNSLLWKADFRIATDLLFSVARAGSLLMPHAICAHHDLGVYTMQCFLGSGGKAILMGAVVPGRDPTRRSAP